MPGAARLGHPVPDRKSTRLNSSHSQISYAVFCLKKKKTPQPQWQGRDLRQCASPGCLEGYNSAPDRLRLSEPHWSSDRTAAPGFFFFNDTATTEIYTLSLHDALPI